MHIIITFVVFCLFSIIIYMGLKAIFSAFVAGIKSLYGMIAVRMSMVDFS